MAKLKFIGRDADVGYGNNILINAMRKYLDDAPDGEVYDSWHLAATLKRSIRHIQSFAWLLGDDYRVKRGRGYWYGNKKTIKNYMEGKYDGC